MNVLALDSGLGGTPQNLLHPVSCFVSDFPVRKILKTEKETKTSFHICEVRSAQFDSVFWFKTVNLDP